MTKKEAALISTDRDFRVDSTFLLELVGIGGQQKRESQVRNCLPSQSFHASIEKCSQQSQAN